MSFNLLKRFDTKKGRFALVLALMLPVLMICLPAPGSAMEFKLGEKAQLDVDVHVQWSGAMRLKDPAAQNLANVNGDDGNRNFDKGDLVNNLFGVTIDADLNFGDYGIFVRPRAYYDFAYSGDNANDSYFTNNNIINYGGPLTSTDKFMNQTLNQHRDKVEVLDLYAYAGFDVAGQFLELRVGRQVVNWGQGLFSILALGTAQNAADTTKFAIPGLELRDAYLPAGQASALMSLPGNFSIGAYYMFEYVPNRLDEAGSYFSNTDYFLKSGRRAIVGGLGPLVGVEPAVDRRHYQEASDDGQYGIALTYIAEWLMDTEFGLYFMNYHDKMPTPIVNNGFGGTRSFPDWGLIAPGPTGAFLNYFDDSSFDVVFQEDIKLYGFSFGTNVGDANINGEIVYRQDAPVWVQDPASPFGLNTYQDTDVLKKGKQGKEKQRKQMKK